MSVKKAAMICRITHCRNVVEESLCIDCQAKQLLVFLAFGLAVGVPIGIGIAWLKMGV